MIGPWSDKLDQISGLSPTPTKGHLPLPCLFLSSSSSLEPPEPEEIHNWSINSQDHLVHYGSGAPAFAWDIFSLMQACLRGQCSEKNQEISRTHIIT